LEAPGWSRRRTLRGSRSAKLRSRWCEVVKGDEALAAHGARGAGCSSEYFGIEALWRRAPRALRGSRSRVFGAKVTEPFGAPSAEALGSRYRRLFRGVGCFGLQRVMVWTVAEEARGIKGFSRSRRSRKPSTSGTHVAHRASSRKARKLEQVGCLGDEETNFLSVKTLKAQRLGHRPRSRGRRPGRKTPRASAPEESGAAVRKEPGGARKPRRGAVAGEV